MKMLARAALGLAALFACASAPAQMTTPQVLNQAGAHVPSEAVVAADRNGAALNSAGTVLTGSISAAGVGVGTLTTTVNGITQSTASSSIGVRGDFNVSLWGNFVATCELDRSFDGGITWLPLTVAGTTVTWSAPTSEVQTEPEAGVTYRLNCPAWTSGTINFRVSL